MPRKQARFGQPAVYNGSTPSLTDGDDSALNVDSAGNLLVNIAAGGTAGSFVSASLYVGQVTVNTTAVQINSSSHALINGVLIKALSTNAANIVVGLTGVTATTGDILEPGESRGYAVNNTNLLYIISPSSTTDKISYEAN